MPAALELAGLLALALAATAVRGGSLERRGLMLLAAVSAASVLAPQLLAADTAAGVLLAVDLAVVLALGRLAWKAPRDWPVWVMAPQAMAAAASLAFLLQADAGAQTYLRALTMARYAAVLLLLLGTWRRPVAHP